MRVGIAWVLMGLVALAAGGVRAETELVVAAYPPLDESVKLAIPRFERLHPGVKVRLQSLAFGDHHNAMITALASGAGVPDVMGVDVGFVGRFAESKDALEDLRDAPYDGAPLLDQLLPMARSLGYPQPGILAAMPADVGPGTLFFRKDLLDRAGVTEAELTASWDSFLEAGKKIRAATGAALLPNAQDIVDVYLRGRLKDGQAIWVSEKGWEAFRSVRDPAAARFREAFALAKRARDAGLDGKVGAWSNEWAGALRSGRIATVMSGTWLERHLETWIAPDTKGLWRAAQLPGGAFASFGGSLYAIPKRAAHKAEAWDFIRLLCLDRSQQIAAWRATGAWPVLRAAQRDAFADEPVPFLGDQRARRVWQAAALRAPMIGVTRCDPAFADVYRAELEQVLEKGKNIDRAIEDAGQQGPWGRHVPRACPYQVAPTRRPTVLTIASFPIFDEVVKRGFERWERNHPDAKIRLVSLPSGPHHAAIAAALASGRDVPDIVVIELGFVGQFGGSSALEDLSVTPPGSEPLLARRAYVREGAFLNLDSWRVVPGEVGPGTLFFRKDLLEQAGVTEEELTRSWDSFLEAGKRIKASTGAYLVANADEIAETYLAAHRGARIYVGERGGPAFRAAQDAAAANFREAFDLAKRAHDAGLDAGVETWSDDWADAVREGRVATAMSGSWLLELLEHKVAPQASGRWRAAQLPAGAYAQLGGALYAIPKKAAHKAEARAFLRLLSYGWDHDSADQGVYYLGGQHARRLWMVAAEQIPPREVTSCDPLAREVFRAELAQVLQGGKGLDRALEDAARRAVEGPCRAERVKFFVVHPVQSR